MKDAVSELEANGGYEVRLITVRELSRMLNVSESQVYKLRGLGKLPIAMRHTRSLRWRRAEIEDWVDAGCPSPQQWKWKRRER